MSSNERSEEEWEKKAYRMPRLLYIGMMAKGKPAATAERRIVLAATAEAENLAKQSIM